jgi:phage head maturation protease
VVGIASTTETPYEMYDMFGPYTEIVSATAFDVTLAADPLVEFTLNHNKAGGAPMAHTRNGTLILAMTEDGLTYDASVDASRHDVSDMLKALERGDLAESSFKFGIDAGRWNEAFDTYTIMQVNLDRGDVSSVNFGANPTTTSGLRHLVEEIADAVVKRVRSDLVPDEEIRHRPDVRTIPGL